MDEPDLFAVTHAHQGEPETAVAAAHRAREFAGTHCDLIQAVLRVHPAGLTSHEIEVLLHARGIAHGHCGLSYHEVARRIPDLKRAGLVVDSGERRRNPSGLQAAVWRVRDG